MLANKNEEIMTNVVEIAPSTVWRDRLALMEGSTKPVNNAANICTTMLYAPEWTGQVWTDVLQHRRMRTVDGRDTPWSDKDSREFMRWLQDQGGFRQVTRNTVEDGISMAADQHERNTLVEYLRKLEWDGETRLSTWLTDYLGVDNTALTNAIGRAWMISAVARALVPGCQADHCLILEGRQGLKKSTLLRDLAGEDYHAEHSAANLLDKDAAIICSGKWIIEFSELGAVKSNRVETVKSFLTRREDHYRPPYERYAKSVPRSCVFAGTTNEEHYLEDQTGNRRYWPVKCHHAATKQLGRDRDQLWAEAVNAYLVDEPWYLDSKLEKMADKEQKGRVTTDAWSDLFTTYLKGKTDTNLVDILVNQIGKQIADITAADMRRGASILRLMSWESYNTTDGKCLRRWRVQSKRHRASFNPDRAVVD